MLKPQTSDKNYEPVPKGNHVARLYSIIDLGTQEQEWKGEKYYAPQVRFTWELLNETKEFEGVMKPLVIGRNYTLSMGIKANLRPIVEGILGVTLRDDEAANFSIEKFKELLGNPCMVNVIHKTSKTGNVYSQVDAVTPIPKGLVVPPQFNPSVIFEIGTSSPKELEALPKFVRELIMRSEEMAEPSVESNVSPEEKAILDAMRNKHNEDKAELDINPSDIPF